MAMSRAAPRAARASPSSTHRQRRRSAPQRRPSAPVLSCCPALRLRRRSPGGAHCRRRSQRWQQRCADALCPCRRHQAPPSRRRLRVRAASSGRALRRLCPGQTPRHLTSAAPAPPRPPPSQPQLWRIANTYLRLICILCRHSRICCSATMLTSQLQSRSLRSDRAAPGRVAPASARDRRAALMSSPSSMRSRFASSLAQARQNARCQQRRCTCPGPKPTPPIARLSDGALQPPSASGATSACGHARVGVVRHQHPRSTQPMIAVTTTRLETIARDARVHRTEKRNDDDGPSRGVTPDRVAPGRRGRLAAARRDGSGDDKGDGESDGMTGAIACGRRTRRIRAACASRASRCSVRRSTRAHCLRRFRLM